MPSARVALDGLAHGVQIEGRLGVEALAAGGDIGRSEGLRVRTRHRSETRQHEHGSAARRGSRTNLDYRPNVSMKGSKG